MNLDRDMDEERKPAWRFLLNWRVIAFVSFLLLLLTQDPVLTGFCPYIRAGWPAVQTAFWLKWGDPWKARGTVGMLFHLCMAGFRAGICGFLFLVVFVIAFAHQPPNLVSCSIAIGSILGGCLISLVLGAIGVVMAFRHQIRIYVMSNLYARCRGDFELAKTMNAVVQGVNPTSFIVAIATATPLLAAWFALMVIVSAGNQPNQASLSSRLVGYLLPLVVIGSVAVVASVSKRIIARSPHDCWSFPAPEIEETTSTWYQS